MKNIVSIFASALILVGASAHARSYAGTYLNRSAPDRPDLNLNEGTCIAKGGEWNVHTCRLPQVDPVRVVLLADGRYEVEMSHNGHKYELCQFKGIGAHRAPAKIVIDGGQGWGTGPDGSMTRGACQFTLKFWGRDRSHVTVSTSGYCQNYCKGDFGGYYGRFEYLKDAERTDTWDGNQNGYEEKFL